jgi:hypothetical protein
MIGWERKEKGPHKAGQLLIIHHLLYVYIRSIHQNALDIALFSTTTLFTMTPPCSYAIKKYFH